MATAATPANFWTKAIAQVITPHPSITSIEQRQQSQLLSIFSLAIPLFLILLPLHQLFAIGLAPEVRLSRALVSLIFLIVLAAVLYALNRAGKYKLSAYGLVLTLFGVAIFPLVGSPLLVVNDFETVFYMVAVSLSVPSF